MEYEYFLFVIHQVTVFLTYLSLEEMFFKYWIESELTATTPTYRVAWGTFSKNTPPPLLCKHNPSLVTTGVPLAQLGLRSSPGAWVACLACHCWLPLIRRRECVTGRPRPPRLRPPKNSRHSGRMFSIPRPCTPRRSERRSSWAHQSLTKGRGLAAGGHQWLLRCPGVPALSHVCF